MNRDLSVEQPSSERRGGEYYDFFGLTFESEEKIPGLVAKESIPIEPVIRIEFGAVPRHIENVEYEDDAVQASGSEYLFTYPGLLRLFVERDWRIVVERLEGCDQVRLWTLVLGAGSSIVGFRRGYIPLHASSISTKQGCVAFGGQSGAGKSTIAASLIERGFELFADDLCLVQWDSVGTPVVGHGVPELRLWEDAVAALDWTGIKPFAVQPYVKKSVFRRDLPQERLAKLRRIYALEFAGEGAESGIFRLEGVEAMQALIGCLRMRLGLLPVGTAQRTFERLAAIGDKVEMFRFVRPLDHGQSTYWLDRLIEHFEA
jgi:hypothetical protein